MKILKILILPIIFIITIIIINITKDNRIYYIHIGDKGYSTYIKNFLDKNNKLKYYTDEFTYKNIRIKDLILKIEDNEEKSISIQNAINKSDIITISIGLDEIYTKYLTNELDYRYIDELISYINNLLNIIKKISNSKIYLLGYYNPTDNIELDKYIKYANNKLKNINNVIYIDLYDIFKNNKHLIYNNIYPNNDGYKLIANKIIKNM